MNDADCDTFRDYLNININPPSRAGASARLLRVPGSINKADSRITVSKPRVWQDHERGGNPLWRKTRRVEEKRPRNYQ